MSNYYLILFWVAIAYIISQGGNFQRIEYVCGQRVQRYTPLWAFLIFLPLIIWCGNRGYVGDTGSYMGIFYSLPEKLSAIPSYMETVTKDEGFYFISAVIKCIIGDDVNLYFLIIAFVQVILLVVVYRKYSPNFIVSFFLFIASTDYVSWLFNGMRQFLAVAITFACFEWILNKKYVLAIVGILLASTMHGSALLVLPFIFIAQGKAWNKKTLFFIMGMLLAVTFIGNFTDLLDKVLSDTQYSNVVSDWQSWEDDGTNILRVLVYAVPAILSFCGLNTIKKTNDPCVNICTNMSIIATGFYIISMFTSGIFIGRIPIYFSLYSYILLPWEIENIFDKNSKGIIYFIMIGAYLLFYYYQVVLVWGLV